MKNFAQILFCLISFILCINAYAVTNVSKSETPNWSGLVYLDTAGSQQSAGLMVCNFDNNNATFKNCRGLENTNYSQSFGMTINPVNHFLYSTNFGNNTISYCKIDNDGSFSKCYTYKDNQISYAAGITLNNKGTIAYIANNFSQSGSGSVLACPINSDGSINSCAPTGSGFNIPYGITLNSSGTMAYVVNSIDNTVTSCNIDSNGSFTNCYINRNLVPSGTSNAISLNATGTAAYISGGITNICLIDSTTGRFSSCNSVSILDNGGFSSKQITIDNIRYLYQSGEYIGKPNTIWRCVVNADNSLGKCEYVSTEDNSGNILLMASDLAFLK